MHLDPVQPPTEATATQMVSDVAMGTHKPICGGKIAPELQDRHQRACHDLGIAEPALRVFSMTDALQVVVTQAIREYNPLVHGGLRLRLIGWYLQPYWASMDFPILVVAPPPQGGNLG